MYSRLILEGLAVELISKSKRWGQYSQADLVRASGTPPEFPIMFQNRTARARNPKNGGSRPLFLCSEKERPRNVIFLQEMHIKV